MTDAITRVNQCTDGEFLQTLGAIYEHSPWVAQQVLPQRPFTDLKELHQSMVSSVAAASDDKKLALLRAHPELAGREAEEGELTADSQTEQKRAGLDQCSPEELVIIRDCNARYREKFGFPFIIAVSGLNRQQVIEAMQTRIDHSLPEEFETALSEVDKIAWIRLQAL